MAHETTYRSLPDGEPRPDVIVQVIEAEETFRNSMVAALTERGYECQAFGSMEAYSASPLPAPPICVVVDGGLPGLAGSVLHQCVEDGDQSVPLVVISGQGGVPVEVQFVEKGSISTLQKPFGPDELAAAVSRSIRIDEMRRHIQQRFAVIEASVERLSPRETKVLNAIINGQLNKAIARSLDVSVRTVEGDRAKIVEKFQAETTGEVVGKYAQYRLLAEMGYPAVGAAAFAV